MSASWPKDVRQMADAVRRAGLEPVVTGDPGGQWEVAVEGKRLRACARYAYRNGRTRYTGGDLTVDGEHRPRADLAELRRIWDEYEKGVVPAAASLAEISDPGDEEAPREVQDLAGVISRHSSAFEVQVGKSEGRWVVGIDLPGDSGIRMIFTRQRNGWGLGKEGYLQVFIDGEDRSAEAGDSLEDALAMITGGQPGSPAPAASPVRRQQGFRDQGVETRRRVVIRE